MTPPLFTSLDNLLVETFIAHFVDAHAEELPGIYFQITDNPDCLKDIMAGHNLTPENPNPRAYIDITDELIRTLKALVVEP